MTKYYYSFKDELNNTNISAFVSTNFYEYTTEVKQKLNALINRFYNKSLECWFEVSDTELDMTQKSNRLIMFINAIKYSIDEYVPLIDLLNNNITDLGNGIKTISTTKFNDTPQSSGTYTTDAYTSTFTKNESETVMDLASKLQLAKQSLEDHYERWINNILRGWMIYD